MDNNLDKFTENIDPKVYNTDEEFKSGVIRKTNVRIGRRKCFQSIKGIAIVCLIVLAVSAFIPDTPVNALYKKIFSWVPGIGVVESDEKNLVTGVLKENVTEKFEKEYVTVNSAYVQNGYMTVKVKTNVGLSDPDMLKKDVLKFFAGELNPKLYLVNKEENIAPMNMLTTGASMEDGTYEIKAGYRLPEEIARLHQFTLMLEGFQPKVCITLTEAFSSTELKDMGNVTVIGEVHVFAELEREADTVKIRLNTVAPKELKDIRFKVFDFEQELFPNGIRLKDSHGQYYIPDQELEKANHADIHTFYFRVPADRKGLKLEIPQVLYSRRITEAYKIKRSNANEILQINKIFEAGENIITMETLELVPAGSEMLPDVFKESNCIKIRFSAENCLDPGNEIICRVLPEFKVKTGLLGDYKTVSQSLNAELWNVHDQTGYSICAVDHLEEYKHLSASFDIECAIISEVEMKLE